MKNTKLKSSMFKTVKREIADNETRIRRNFADQINSSKNYFENSRILSLGSYDYQGFVFTQQFRNIDVEIARNIHFCNVSDVTNDFDKRSLKS